MSVVISAAESNAASPCQLLSFPLVRLTSPTGGAKHESVKYFRYDQARVLLTSIRGLHCYARRRRSSSAQRFAVSRGRTRSITVGFHSYCCPGTAAGPYCALRPVRCQYARLHSDARARPTRDGDVRRRRRPRGGCSDHRQPQGASHRRSGVLSRAGGSELRIHWKRAVLVRSRQIHVGSSFAFELVSGNHEDDARPNGFIDNFAACLPDRMNAHGRYGAEYYFDVGPLIRVIVIAPNLRVGGVSYEYVQGNSRYAWLAQRIDEARAAAIPWVIVGMHKVCITLGEKSCEIGADLMNLLISKRVDLVLQGHDHTYQRSKQLTCASRGSFMSACVVDDGSDDTYTKGAGTIFVVAGAFGNTLYLIDTLDPEVGYFATSLGSNAN